MMKDNNDNALVQKLAFWTQGTYQYITPISGLSLHKRDNPTAPMNFVLDASLCLVVQGKKQVMLGEEIYVYDANHFLFTSIDLPVVSQVFEATPDKPYLSFILRLDPHVLAQLIIEMQAQVLHKEKPKSGVVVGEVTNDLRSAFERLLDLLDRPDDIPILAPLIIKEIFYRLLMSPQGDRLKDIALAGTIGHRIGKAIDWIKKHYDQAFTVDDVASRFGMSSSSFYQHFREVTSMSPVQYQKRMRLTQARQLLMTDRQDVGHVSAMVGYESLSQFSREYKRFFGATPSEDMKSLLQ